ncbi:MAG: hypothetical protein Q8R97_04675 [Brevundimonas sp.]|nr:hypothetical protein [Brevundimonas sp.]
MAAAPFLGAFLAGFLPTRARNLAAGLSWTVALAGLICAVLLYPAVADGGVVRHEISWLPSLGVNIVLRLDGLSWLFSMLVLGIGVLVILYARYYMAATDPVPRFFSFLLAFMGAMLGVVVSGNIIQLVVFWELTSLFSFLLIGYWHHSTAAREGARMALTVTASGGFACWSAWCCWARSPAVSIWTSCWRPAISSRPARSTCPPFSSCWPAR